MQKLKGFMDGKGFILAMFLLAGDFKADPRLAWMPVDLTLLFAVLTALVCLRELVKHRFRVPKSLGLVVLLYLFFLLPLYGTEWNPYALDKVNKLFTLTFLASIAPMLLLRTKEDLRKFLHALAVLGLVLALSASYTLLTGGDLQITDVKQSGITAFGSDTIALGRAAGMGFIWYAVLMLEGRLGIVKTILLVGLLAVTMLGSGSRGPLLSAVGAVAMLGVLKYWKKPSQTVRFAAVVLILAATVVYGFTVAPEESTQRIQTFLSGQLGYSELMRLEAYQRSWQVIQVTPLGIGWGGFPTVINLWFGDLRQYPHNLVIEVFLEAGWAAGAVLVLLLSGAMLRAFRRSVTTEQRALFALYFFYISNALVSGDVNDNKILFAFLSVALALGGGRREEKSLAAESIQENRSSHFRAQSVRHASVFKRGTNVGKSRV